MKSFWVMFIAFLVCLVLIAVCGCFGVWRDLGINAEMLFGFWGSLITLLSCSVAVALNDR